MNNDKNGVLQMNDNEKLVLVNKSVDFTHYNEIEFADAVSRILRHKQSTIKFRTVLSGANGATFSGDYSMGRISHNYFSNCVFDGALLKNVAGTGSIFSDIKFINTDISHSSFQSSTIERCSFEACVLQGCNLSDCYIQDTTWLNCPSGAANMTSSYLKNCTFINTKPGNLAEACLDGVHFENIRLTNFNLEFASFQKINTENVVLPFSQMPYIFGGLQYLIETKDSVRISSHINNSHSISIDEYISVLKDMEIFYSYQKEYFPLANIFLAFQRYDEALGAILLGIKTSALQRDFRMCKYYCKLITENGSFSDETLKSLYQSICDVTPVHKLAESQYYQYLRHMPEVKAMLIENPNGYPHATLRLETNISDQNSSHVSTLLSCLDDFIHLKGSTLTKPSISISHNSDLVFIINLCGSPLGIVAAAALILSVIGIACKTYNEIAQSIISTQTIIENRQKKRKNKLQEQIMAAELEKLALENADLSEKMALRRRQITASGIIITRAEMIGQDFDPMKLLKL